MREKKVGRRVRVPGPLATRVRKGLDGNKRELCQLLLYLELTAFRSLAKGGWTSK